MLKKFLILSLTLALNVNAQSFSSVLAINIGKRHPNEIAPSSVKFKISKSQKTQETLWYAGKELGLLVTEEELTDGTGLISNWHNEKELASAIDAVKEYDLDKNDILEEKELASLKIWFDENNDGKADFKEFKDLSDLAIKSISLKNFETFNNELFNINFRYANDAVDTDSGKLTLLEWNVPADATPLKWTLNLRKLKSNGYQIWQYIETPRVENNQSSIDGYLIWKNVEGKLSGYEVRALTLKPSNIFYRITVFDLVGTQAGLDIELHSSCKNCQNTSFKTAANLILKEYQQLGEGQAVTEVSKAGVPVETLHRSWAVSPSSKLPDFYTFK